MKRKSPKENEIYFLYGWMTQKLKSELGWTEEDFIREENKAKAAFYGKEKHDEAKPIGSNMTEVETGPYTILFSYQEPVAYHYGGIAEDKRGFYRTNKFWSVTTSKHINKWLAGAKAQEVDQEDIYNITDAYGIA